MQTTTGFRSSARTCLAAKAQTVPIAESETITIGAREYSVRYDGEKMQRIEKAVMKRIAGTCACAAVRFGARHLESAAA